MDYYDDLFPDMDAQEVLRAAVSQSVHAKPVDSISGLLWTYRVDELRNMARGFGLRKISKLNKSGLVSAISACMDEPREQLLDYVQSLGTDFLNGMRALFEAGGRIEVPRDHLTSLGQLVMPHPPCSMLFDWNETFYCVMPVEIREKLLGADWEQMLRVSSAIDEAVDFLDLAVDLRGIVHLDEAIAEYRARTPEAAHADVIEKAVHKGASGKKTCFVPMQLLDECCLVHGLLAEESSDDPARSDLIVDVYMGQESMPPRPVSDALVEAGGVTEQVLMSGHIDSFAQCIVKRLPADVDSESFVPVVMIMVVAALRCSHDFCDLLEVLRHVGYCASVAEADELATSYAMLMAHVPRWDRNGWSWAEEACGLAEGMDGAEVLQFIPRQQDSPVSSTHEPSGEVVSFTKPDKR